MTDPPSTLEASQRNAVSLRGVGKRFGGTTALVGIDLDVSVGTVHALVGENGAGKSTCLGIIGGRISPSSGSVRIFDKSIKAANPRAARAAGVAAIYQELTTVPALTAEANVFLGQARSRRGLRSDRLMRRRYIQLCERYDLKAFPGVESRKLSVADQQILEILRAVVSEARLFLFDEPTASLGEHERESLFRLMADLKSDGATLVLVSHNLDEVLREADIVTVFRDGRLVRTAEKELWSKASLVTAMLALSGEENDTGRQLAESVLEASTFTGKVRSGEGQTPLLEVQGLSVPGVLSDVNLSVRAGEVVGVAGMVGSGRSTLLRSLAGAESKAKGTLIMSGVEMRWPRNVRQARRRGVALLPEDRKTQGLELRMSAADNIALGSMGRLSRGGLLSRRRTRTDLASTARRFRFDVARLSELAANLSGGNQQKLLLARMGYLAPRIVLVDEPTRGVDVGAKRDILAALDEMASEGLALLVVSSEFEELTAICNRFYVIAEGKIVARLNNADETIEPARLVREAFAAD